MSDELAAALRELAAQHETPPRIAAAEIRSRAGRRSRRRRAAAALGAATAAACALAAVAVTLHPGEPGADRHSPATAQDTPAPDPSPGRTAPLPARAPAGILDLGRHSLTVGDRVMRVGSHSFRPFTPGSELTVVAKDDAGLLRVETGAKGGYEIKVPYLVELRAPGGQPVYAGALALDMKAFGAFDAEASWISMEMTDARWFFGRARAGDRIALTSTVTPSAETPPAPSETATRDGDGGEGTPRAARSDRRGRAATT